MTPRQSHAPGFPIGYGLWVVWAGGAILFWAVAEPLFHWKDPIVVFLLGTLAFAGTAVCILSGQLRDARNAGWREAERFRAVSDCVPQILWTSKPDGAFDFLNARWYEYTGTEPGSGLGNEWAPLVHPEDLPGLVAYRDEVRALRLPGSREFRIRRFDGLYRWFSERTTPLFDRDGGIAKWCGSNTDVQEARELRETAHAEADRFARIVATAPGVICEHLLRPDGSICMPFASARIREIFDIEPDELALDASRMLERIHPEDRGRVMESILASAETMSIWQTTFRVRNPQRGELWVDACSSPVRQSDGGTAWYGFLSDVTARKQADGTIRSQATYELGILQSLLEYAPIGIAMVDRAMRHVMVSQRWADMHGQLREHLLQNDHYTCFPNLPEEWKAAHRRALSGETLSGHEEAFLAPDGSLRWINWVIAPWGDSGEKTGGIVFFSEDVTARKNAEALARKHEIEYHALFENMSEGLAYCELLLEDGKATDYRYLAVNEGFAKVFGPEGVVGRTMREVFGGEPPTEPPVFEVFARVGLSGKPEKLECFARGMKQWISVSVYSPEPRFFVCILDLITGRKQAEAAARLWQRAFEQSELAIALGNPITDTIEAANSAYARTLGYSREELIGRAFAELYPPSELGHRGSALRSADSEAGHALFESVYIRKDGSRFPVLVDITAVRDDAGKVVSRVKFVHDITANKRAEQEIRDLNSSLESRVRERTSQLEAANRELESFSYSVSHDLRAPLRGIDGWSSALLEDYGDRLEPEARKYLDRVRAETQRMGLLIDDLLQLSKVTRSEMRSTSVDLSGMATNIAEILREANPSRSIEFSIQPGMVARGDKRLLEIVLTNLFDNAIKFTRTRSTAFVEFGRTSKMGKSAFFVKDNGVGFETRHAATLFGPFQRLHKSSEFPGTGIGLATVKRVVLRHGGEVWATAEPDRGATFVFTLGG